MDLVFARLVDNLKLYLILVLVCLTLVGADRVGWAASVKAGIAQLMVRMQDGTRDALGVMATPLAAVRDYESMERELALIQEQLKEAYVDQAELEQLRAENTDLKQLSEVELDVPPGKRLVAKVIEAQGGYYLDKGAREGVAEGMVVVDPQGLVAGAVAAVNPYLSRLELLTDTSSVVGVRVLGKATTGVLVGDGFRGELREVLQTDSLEVGDVLVTNSSEGNYPDGLVVGDVLELIGTASDVTKGALVNLRVDIRDTVVVLQ